MSACSTKLSSDDQMASHAMACFGAARDAYPYMPPSHQMMPYVNNSGPTPAMGMGMPGFFQSSAAGSGETSYGLGPCSKASTIFERRNDQQCFGAFDGASAKFVNFIPYDPATARNEPKQFYLGTPFNPTSENYMSDPVSRPVAQSFGTYTVGTPSCGL